MKGAAPFVAVNLSHLKPGNHSERLGDAAHCVPADILLGDDEDGLP